MQKNHFYTSFGLWLIILPFFGIPGAWKEVLVFVSGLFLILVSLGPIILIKLQSKTKPKPKRVVNKKIADNELRFSEKDTPLQEKTENEIAKLE